jgi:hypothetical protein
MPNIQDEENKSTTSAQAATPPIQSTKMETPLGTIDISGPLNLSGDDDRLEDSSGAGGGPRPPSVTDDSDTGDSFFGQLNGIPIEYLIAAPLMASARAQFALAQVITEFVDEIGFDENNNTRVVKFSLTREFQNPATQEYTPQTIQVQAPLLALVPIPSLLIQSVNIDLTVEVSQVISKSTVVNSQSQLQVGAKWGWGDASFTGTLSTSSNNTRTTNQSAKYEVTVNAQQQPLPEGMSRLMDVFASTITPVAGAGS